MSKVTSSRSVVWRCPDELRPDIASTHEISHSRADYRMGIGCIQICRLQNQRSDNFLQRLGQSVLLFIDHCQIKMSLGVLRTE